MKKHDKGFEDFFRESFEGAEMTPSKHVWENISNRLDGKTQARPTYWWSGGIAAALLLMFCAYIVVYNPFASSTATSNNTVIANQVSKSENNQETKQEATIKNNGNVTQNPVTASNDIARVENNTDNKISNNKEITNKTNDKVSNNIDIKTDNKTISKNSNQNKIAIVGSNIENKNTKNKVEKDVLSKVVTTKTFNNKSTTTQEKNTNTPNKDVKTNNTNKINNETKKETKNGINKIATETTNQVIAANANSSKNSEELITVDNQLTLLASLGFAIIPNELKPMNVIFVPMVITKTTIAKPIIKSKAGFEVMFVGSYNSFNPNFSNVKDGVYPNPFVKHSNPQSGNVYDSTLIASGLANPMRISSYSAGVVFNKNIYKNLGLRTGINYTSISYDIEHKLSFFDRSGASAGSELNKLHQQTQLVNVPISVFYQQETGKFVYGLQAGIQADILLSNKLDNDLFVAGNHVYSFGTYNNMNINALAGLRFGYMINSHFSINLEANYRKALGSVYDTPYLQSNPQSLGMGMGLGYKF